MKKVKDFLKTCSIGTYFIFATIVTSLISLILIGVGFQAGYHSYGSLVCLILLIVLDVVLLIIKKEAFIPAANVILSLGTILFFILTSYNYVAVVVTGIDIENFNIDWVLSTIFFIATYVLSFASIFIPLKKKGKVENQQITENNEAKI